MSTTYRVQCRFTPKGRMQLDMETKDRGNATGRAFQLARSAGKFLQVRVTAETATTLSEIVNIRIERL